MKIHFLFSLFFITIPLICCEKKETIVRNNAHDEEGRTLAFFNRRWLEKARARAQQKAKESSQKVTATKSE